MQHQQIIDPRRRDDAPPPTGRAHILYKGRKFFIYGALLLMVWSGYEGWVRLETVIPWFKSVWNYISAGYMTVQQAIDGADPGVYEGIMVLAFLLCCFVLGVVCLCVRNRPIASMVIFPASLGLAIYATGLHSLLQPNLWQFLKILPLLMITTGAMVNIMHFCLLKHQRRRLRRKQMNMPPMPELPLAQPVTVLDTQSAQSLPTAWEEPVITPVRQPVPAAAPVSKPEEQIDKVYQ